MAALMLMCIDQLDELELDRVEERKAIRSRLQAVKQAARGQLLTMLVKGTRTKPFRFS